MNGNLPDGWAWNNLNDLTVKITDGTHFTPTYVDSGVAFISVKDIYDSKVNFDNCKFIPEEEHNQLIKRCFPKSEDVLITKSGTIGRVAVVRTNRPFSLFVSVALLKPRKEFLNSDFLAVALQNYINGIDIKQSVKGGVIKNLHIEDIKNIKIPVPPIPEQERIVAKIEELFTQLDAGTAALKRVQAGLKRYKTSVLKAAMEGRLFDVGADAIRPAGLESLSAQIGRTPSARTDQLPDGWRQTRLDEIADTIGGATKGRDLTGKSTITLPYLRVANVQRGKLQLEVMKEIEILASEIEKYRLQSGDVVLTEGGDWDKLGRSAIWRNQIPNCIHQNHIFRARMKAIYVIPEWLMYYTNSEQGQNYFKEAAKQTTNLASINLTQLRACPIPLPPLAEQRRIVAEVERRLEGAAQVEAALAAAVARASRLRQAVLKSAFEGRLVS